MKWGSVIVVMFLAGCHWSPGSESSRIREAQEVVARELRDPGSAQFRDVREVELDNGMLAYCGEVNGKNAFGAYSGYRAFVLRRGTNVALQPASVEDGDYRSVANNMDFVALQLQICALKQANRSPPPV